jgi:NAD(P)-dependent dehydrogenase (short-subunit alcohol dehydrogenase family)
VINITSGWGMRGGRGNFMYSIAKGGVIQLTKTLAMTYARDNIRVTCIARLDPPGIRGQRDQRAAANRPHRLAWRSDHWRCSRPTRPTT